VVVLPGAPIEEAAFACLADFPLQLELEIAELVFADEVAHRTIFRHRAVFDAPPLRHGAALVAAPRVERLAVEEHLHCGWRMADCGLLGRVDCGLRMADDGSPGR